MPAAVEAAFAEHSGHIAVIFKQNTALFLVAVEVGSGDQAHGHHFGGRHLALWIVSIFDGTQKIVANAVEYDNMKVHGCPRFVLGGTNTLPEVQPCASPLPIIW